MKKYFSKVKIVIIIVLLLSIIFSLYIYLFPKKYTNKDFSIEDYKSKIDKDLDGIEDQEDILLGVKKYLETKPKYKSKYYDGGYPNDNYGVCTDIVAFGLKDAGYDLMELVYQDIKENREEYKIEVVDKNIDFRRVRNLIIYFKRNAISLTTNPKEIDKWQAGDIVIYKNHIGVISEHRNKKGIPYIYHNASVYQLQYEEDVLETFGKIIGHYRIS